MLITYCSDSTENTITHLKVCLQLPVSILYQGANVRKIQLVTVVLTCLSCRGQSNEAWAPSSVKELQCIFPFSFLSSLVSSPEENRGNSSASDIVPPNFLGQESFKFCQTLFLLALRGRCSCTRHSVQGLFWFYHVFPPFFLGFPLLILQWICFPVPCLDSSTVRLPLCGCLLLMLSGITVLLKA